MRGYRSREDAPLIQFSSCWSTFMTIRRSTLGVAAPAELSALDCTAVSGGMMKLPGQTVSPGSLLTSPDGEPVSVYVDGMLINSVRDGFVHL
jgi:hypothetical protein